MCLLVQARSVENNTPVSPTAEKPEGSPVEAKIAATNDVTTSLGATNHGFSSSGALYQLGATATQEAASAPPARAAREEEGLEEAAPGANPYSALELDVADEGNGLADSTDGGTAAAEGGRRLHRA